MPHRPSSRPRSAVVGAAVTVTAAALLLAGRSGGDDPDESSSSSQSSASTTTSPSSSDTASGSADTDESPSASAAPQGDPFTTLDGFVDDDKVTLDVYPLRRIGDLVVLQLRMTVAPDADGSSQIAQTFDDGDSDTGANDLDSTDALELVDGENSKVYLVATDTEHRCLCSDGLGSAIIEPGQSVTLDASFAAPPDDVSSVDLRIRRSAPPPTSRSSDRPGTSRNRYRCCVRGGGRGCAGRAAEPADRLVGDEQRRRAGARHPCAGA